MRDTGGELSDARKLLGAYELPSGVSQPLRHVIESDGQIGKLPRLRRRGPVLQVAGSQAVDSLVEPVQGPQDQTLDEIAAEQEHDHNVRRYQSQQYYHGVRRLHELRDQGRHHGERQSCCDEQPEVQQQLPLKARLPGRLRRIWSCHVWKICRNGGPPERGQPKHPEGG